MSQEKIDVIFDMFIRICFKHGVRFNTAQYDAVYNEILNELLKDNVC
jgi:hypothetical protein